MVVNRSRSTKHLPSSPQGSSALVGLLAKGVPRWPTNTIRTRPWRETRSRRQMRATGALLPSAASLGSSASSSTCRYDCQVCARATVPERLCQSALHLLCARCALSSAHACRSILCTSSVHASPHTRLAHVVLCSRSAVPMVCCAVFFMAYILGYRRYEARSDSIALCCHTNGLGHVIQMLRILSVLNRNNIPVRSPSARLLAQDS